MLTTGAEWCTACIEEQPILEAFYNEYKNDGLRIVEVLFEDINYEPADSENAQNWKTANNVSYDVVADPDFSFEIYQDRSLTPLVMLVEVNTMIILKMTSGFDETLFEALVRSKFNEYLIAAERQNSSRRAVENLRHCQFNRIFIASRRQFAEPLSGRQWYFRQTGSDRRLPTH